MSTPKRNSRPEAIQSDRRTFHVQSSTWGKRSLLQSEAMATLLTDTLLHYRDQHEYKLHAFVVMRDHFHVLLTIEGRGTIERVMQKIKGGFSYRARAELGFRGEIWQRVSLMSGFGMLNSSFPFASIFTIIRFGREW